MYILVEDPQLFSGYSNRSSFLKITEHFLQIYILYLPSGYFPMQMTVKVRFSVLHQRIGIRDIQLGMVLLSRDSVIIPFVLYHFYDETLNYLLKITSCVSTFFTAFELDYHIPHISLLLVTER